MSHETKVLRHGIGRLAMILALAQFAPIAAQTPAPQSTPYFRIECVDAATGRGVPMIELKTTGQVRYVSDNHGLVAFLEPGLMGRQIYLTVQGHGYELGADRFGYRGVRVTPIAGKSAKIRLKRINIAERMYRVTGAGLYHDSILLGEPTPLAQPLLAGGVVGQDSVHAVPFRGELHWIWGDTNRPGYPLGNFAVSGAVSRLPQDGGLDPALGIDLEYRVDGAGFSRAMCSVPGPGPRWIDGLARVVDGEGRERIIGKYVRVRSLGVLLERGLVLYDAERRMFDRLIELDLDMPFYPYGHPAEITVDGAPYLAFGNPFPNMRVPATLAAIQDPSAYESFTCLAPGTVFAGADSRIEPEWSWQRETGALSMQQEQKLEKAGLLDSGAGRHALRDVLTSEPIRPHGGSVYWNQHRQCWVAVVLETGGTSYLGEVWYAEGDTLLGPWVYARKIVTHERMSFYNPTQHPWFDQNGGRTIYFEGTYTHTFSGNQDRTPRYDYNQIMYRLDLDDPRLVLPAPVYRLDDGSLAMRAQIAQQDAWMRVLNAEFYAADRAGPGLIPVDGLCFAVAPGEEGKHVGTVALYRNGEALSLQGEQGAETIAYVWPAPHEKVMIDRVSRTRVR